jgi:hypothetical protein
VRFGAFRKLGRCGLLRRVLPKQQDFSRPLTQSLRVTICESCICGLIACSVCRERAFLRECGFRAHTSPPSVAKRQAKRSRAMRPRWLAWAAFIFGPLWTRIFTDQRGSGKNRSQDARPQPVSPPGSNFLDYSLSIRHTIIRFVAQTPETAAAFSRQSNYATTKKRSRLRFPKAPRGVHK